MRDAILIALGIFSIGAVGWMIAKARRAKSLQEPEDDFTNRNRLPIDLSDIINEGRN